MGLGVRPWRVIAVLLFALLASRPACAREVDLSICIARVNPGESAEQVLARPTRFSCDANQRALGAGHFVTRLDFPTLAHVPGEPFVLRLASVWQDSARVLFRYADGVQRETRFDSRSVPQFLTIGAVIELPVPDRNAALQSVAIETTGSANLRGVVVSARLMSATDAGRFKMILAAIYAAFGGLALALIAYNLSLWFALRNRFQIDYCSMVIALCAYTFTSSGALNLVFPLVENNDRLRLNYVLLAVVAVTALRFVRNFFEANVCGPRWRLVIKVACWAALGSSLAFAAMAPAMIGLLDKIYFISLTALLLIGIPLLFNAVRLRARYSRLFLLAWSAPVATSLLRAAYGFGFVPYSILVDNGNVIAMSIEALLSSIMVTARIRNLANERDNAVEGEQTARLLAATDPLTGLLNRRAFLDAAIGKRTRQRLLLIDIDHFKAVNDRLGHEAGDQVLVRIAKAIDQFRPERSLAVRLGGEEFALLIPRALAENCSAESLLKAIRSTVMPQGLKVTVSIGVSDGQVASEEDWKRLYRLADTALYRAKADGRNRACKATDFRTAA